MRKDEMIKRDDIVITIDLAKKRDTTDLIIGRPFTYPDTQRQFRIMSDSVDAFHYALASVAEPFQWPDFDAFERVIRPIILGWPTIPARIPYVILTAVLLAIVILLS
jgi:hypothetical protein